MGLRQIVDIKAHPVLDRSFRDKCKKTLDRTGLLILPGFLTPNAIAAIYKEGQAGRDRASFCKQNHNVFLAGSDLNFPPDNPCNLEVLSSKSWICDDVVAVNSPLRQRHNSEEFRRFLFVVFSEKTLYEYSDTLTTINLHYSEPGQELGWHFDNSSFAITLMIKVPEQGGNFENGDINYKKIISVLDGYAVAQTLDTKQGDLVLFRGCNSLHRVAPVEGLKTRILAVLAYNSEPGIALSETARQTFFGRIS